VTSDVFNALFGSGALFGVPSLILWTIVAAAIGYFVYAETRFGAHVHAIGDSAKAARATGIRVLRLRFGVMVLSGTLAALAGLLYAGRLHGARYTLGEADLLTVIAAVIVGGTRLNGGMGSIIGALIGSLLMGMLNNGLILMGFEPSDQMIARGLIILIAVALTLREPNR
jgi:ribose transport system permease protein